MQLNIRLTIRALTLLICFLPILSCQEGAKETPKTGPRLSKEQIESVGIKHNEALAATLAYFNKNATPKTTAKEYIGLAKASIRKFGDANTPTLTAEQQKKREEEFEHIASMFNSVLNTSTSGGRIQETIQVALDGVSSYTTNGERSHINDVFDAVTYYEFDFTSLNSRLNQIEASAYNLPYGEADLPLVAVSVARYSLNYWAAYGGVWIPDCEGCEPYRIQQPINWGGVAKIDVASAVIGAITSRMQGWWAEEPIGWARTLGLTWQFSALGSTLGAVVYIVTSRGEAGGQTINMGSNFIGSNYHIFDPY